MQIYFIDAHGPRAQGDPLVDKQRKFQPMAMLVI